MADNNEPDYKALFLKAEEERREERERNQQTTLEEFIRACHNLLSRPLGVAAPSRSTKGTIPSPTGKYCPTQLVHWTDCPAEQQEIYNAVINYLHPADNVPRLFSPLVELQGLGRRFSRRPISSEKDLESYERFAVEDHVHDVITELCEIPNAQREFQLGSGIRFDNHGNSLDEVQDDQLEESNPHHSRPDQFCIHRVDGNTNTLLTTVEYKPPHKLSVENLRVGLRPMEFWKTVVKPDTTPTDEEGKLRYNAERLVGSAIVQEYHVMIQEGLEYSYVTNGLALVLLRVPYDNPSTLLYYLCEPNLDVNMEDDQSFQQPKTTIGRVLCLCLMSFRSHPRDQEWRNAARARLHVWKTSFDHTRSQIPEAELQRNPPDSEYTGSEYASTEYTASEYLPSSSPVESPTANSRRVPTRSQVSCMSMNTMRRAESTESSDSDSNHAASGRKRGFSQVTSSPPTQRSARQMGNRHDRSNQYQEHTTQFCTQRCLLGLQQGGELDDYCPNVKLHQKGGDSRQHLINTKVLVKLLKTQLDGDIDYNCTPFGDCGGYGAPFKITCTAYGYTVVGKGTTSRLWKEVSHEAEIYQVLRRAQGSAVPVFLGAISLAKIYFLHGAGEIRHMLLMAWGGESTTKHKQRPVLRREISRSMEEVRSLGVIHQDLRPDNILWNEELKRALIIDFHRSELDRQLMGNKMKSLKRPLCRTEEREPKRLCVV